MKFTGSVVTYLFEFLIPACYTRIRVHSARRILCMKMYCNFLLNITGTDGNGSSFVTHDHVTHHTDDP